jgi:hypothetical protein
MSPAKSSPRCSLDLDRLDGNLGLPAKPATLLVFLHRINNPAALAQAVALHDRATTFVERHEIRWGIETDVHYIDGELRIAHSQRRRREILLSEHLRSIPDSMPVMLELKDSLEHDSACSQLVDLLEKQERPFILASFNARILQHLPRREGLYRCLMSFNATGPRWSLGGLYECFRRWLGAMGGSVDDTRIDVLAYPWRQATDKMLEALTAKGIVTIAGGVDTPRAVRHALEAKLFGVLTDSPTLFSDP